jgi:TonB-linked SusC/RagA family outer membrane protein
MNRTTFSTLRIVGVVAALLAAAVGSAQAQRAVIRGTVVSEGGQPIEGGSVFIPELAIQTATDATGKYSMTVPGTRVRGQTVNLRVRMIGFRPSSRTVTVTAGEQVFDFTLAADVNRLEEIVVTGSLEAVSKTQMPFDITHVEMADLPVPAVDPLHMLAGRVPGANIVSGNGRPGEAPSIILRGPTSLNASGRSQDPLYILDGVIINGNLPALNPEDIENIEVVKGAAASSLYGARAGNGVIQITTRSGRLGRDGMTWNFRTEAGQGSIEHSWPLAQNTALLYDASGRFCVSVTGQPICARTINYQTEQARVNNVPGDFALVPASFPLDPGATTISGQPLRNTFQAMNWPGNTYSAVNQAAQPRPFYNNNLDVTGRFGETQFFASGSWTDQGGSIRYLSGFNRWTGRLNVDQRIGTQWSVGFRSFYSHSWQDGLNQQNGGGAFFRLTRVPAIVSLLQTDTLGRLYVRTNLQNGGEQNENPLIDLQGLTDIAITDRFIGGMTLRYSPFTWADIEGNASYDWQNWNENCFAEKGFRSTSSNFAPEGGGPSCGNNGSAGQVLNYRQVQTSFNTSLSATIRHDFTRDLQTRWNLRYLYNQQDQNTSQGYGNTLASVGIPTLSNTTTNFSVTTPTLNRIKEIGYSAGVSATYKERYIAEALMRRDGSSLFGASRRWATFGRGSLAWRVSQEPFWPLKDFINEFKLRGSRGSAGGRPRFDAQYETFGVSAGGISLGNLGNKLLKPEVTTETELGVDAEFFRRIGLTVTHAQSQTENQILPVPVPAYFGFGTQWQNAGTLGNKTWEVSLNVPVIQKRDLSWSWRFSYDRTRTTILALGVPPFTYGVGYQQGADQIFRANAGEEYGTFYGKYLLRNCSELPAPFSTDCGTPTSSFQRNDQGFLVWTGGHSPGAGITNNLYQTQLPGGCYDATTKKSVPCATLGAPTPNAVNYAPWGVALNWGMLITLRDTSCLAIDAKHPAFGGPRSDCPAMQVPLGNALPRYNFAITQNFQWRRLSVYALLSASMGRKVWNEGRHWSFLDLVTSDVDQAGRSIEAAKPLGYYYRSSPPENGSGINGFYQTLAPNSFFVEDASYGKLRELSVAYNLGAIGGWGNWTASLVGRNLFTITGYHGFDPEVGDQGSTTGSAAINAVDAFTFPNTRTVTFALSTSF